MDRFVSTRGGDEHSVQQAVLSGTAEDGGLYMPLGLRDPAHVSDIDAWGAARAGADFLEVAQAAALRLFPSMDSVGDLCAEAFDFEVPLPSVEDDHYILDLTRGPTLAFKDFGARFLARLAARTTTGNKRTVLVATSGDTGGAVADAFSGVDGFRVVALFPAEGVSARQRRQMSTVGGDVHAVAVQGDFDDCQRLVKEAFGSDGCRARHRLMSANSINIGRLLPQALYYMYAATRFDVPVTFVVPSGNLGNLCAGLIAHRLGMPAVGFVAALNANTAFADFLGSRDQPSAPTKATLSSAMDVSRPSNLERLRWLYPSVEELRGVVSAESVSDAETKACITDIYERTGMAIDPHTSVGYVAASRRRSEGPVVVLSTAHPAKFPGVVEQCIGTSIDTPATLQRILDADEIVHEIEPHLAALERQLEAF